MGFVAESETTPIPVLAADCVPASATPGFAVCGVEPGSAWVRATTSAGVAWWCPGAGTDTGVTGP